MKLEIRFFSYKIRINLIALLAILFTIAIGVASLIYFLTIISFPSPYRSESELYSGNMAFSKTLSRIIMEYYIDSQDEHIQSPFDLEIVENNLNNLDKSINLKIIAFGDSILTFKFRNYKVSYKYEILQDSNNMRQKTYNLEFLSGIKTK